MKRTALARPGWLLLAVLTGVILSCRNVRQGPMTRAVRLQQDKLDVVVQRLGSQPEYKYSDSEQVAVHVSVDPQVADIARLRGYHLWLLDGSSGEWSRVATADKVSKPVDFVAAGEGIHGLRVSLIDEDGEEILIPRINDPPHVWFCVDKTPPILEFSQSQRRTLRARSQSLDLLWSAREMQFGQKEVELEWSDDRGRTWNPIAKVQPTSGTNRYRWQLPKRLRRRSDDLTVDVRVRAWDLAGHVGTLQMSLNEDEGGAALATAQATGSEAEAVEPAMAKATAEGPAESPADDAEDAAASGETPADGELTERYDLARLEPLADCLRGGTLQSVRWQTAAGTVDEWERSVYLEYLLEGSTDWQLAAVATLNDGAIEWRLPDVTARDMRLRLVTRERDGRPAVIGEQQLSVDSTAPELSFATLAKAAGLKAEDDAPFLVAAELRLPLAVDDDGCAGLETVGFYSRRQGESFWSEGHAATLETLDSGDEIVFDLGSFQEGIYDVYLVARDKAGNASAAPGPSTGPQGRILVDLVPPAIVAKPSSEPWVAGFRAAVEVQFDAVDCVEPLIVEGKQAGESEWKELRRFNSPASIEGRIEFDLPLAASKYEVRVAVRDAAGNTAEARFGPHPVARPIELESFLETRYYPAYDSQEIAWKLHPVALAVKDNLKVSVEHRAGPQGAWEEVCESRSAEPPCYWDLPGADGVEHTLRVRLFRAGRQVGEQVSAPFRIKTIDDTLLGETDISGPSVIAFLRARQSEKHYRDALKSTSTPKARLTSLANATRQGYEDAITLDDNNYQACYSLARFLNLLDPRKNAADVLQLLERTVEIKSDHVWALNDLGAAHIRAGKYAEAEKVLQQSIRIEDSALARYNLGLALLYQEKAPAAREELTTALKNPGEAPEGDAYFYIVFSHILEGDTAAAKAVYTEKAELMPAPLRAEIEKQLRS